VFWFLCLIQHSWMAHRVEKAKNSIPRPAWGFREVCVTWSLFQDSWTRKSSKMNQKLRFKYNSYTTLILNTIPFHISLHLAFEMSMKLIYIDVMAWSKFVEFIALINELRINRRKFHPSILIIPCISRVSTGWQENVRVPNQKNCLIISFLIENIP